MKIKIDGIVRGVEIQIVRYSVQGRLPDHVPRPIPMNSIFRKADSDTWPQRRKISVICPKIVVFTQRLWHPQNARLVRKEPETNEVVLVAVYLLYNAKRACLRASRNAIQRECKLIRHSNRFLFDSGRSSTIPLDFVVGEVMGISKQGGDIGMVHEHSCTRQIRLHNERSGLQRVAASKTDTDDIGVGKVDGSRQATARIVPP